MSEKTIDNYALSIFKECPYKYHLRMNRNIVSCRPNLPAQFGIAIHEGLAEHYRGKSLDEAVKAFKESWQEFEGMKPEYSIPLGVMMLTYYVQTDKLEPLHVEVGIAVEIPQTKWVYTGRIDLVARLDDVMFVIDHKTRAKSLSTFNIEPNFQLVGYAYGVQQTLGLESPPGIMVNLINVSSKKSSGEFNLKMTHSVKPEDYQRFIESVQYYTDGIEVCFDNGFPRIGVEFHCAWCEYKELCVSPHLEERLIEGGVYKRSEWKAYE